MQNRETNFSLAEYETIEKYVFDTLQESKTQILKNLNNRFNPLTLTK
jgi:hypothetical protein